MAIFPNLILEPVVQVNDKTRLDATKSYISNETEDITKVEISPDGGVTYADVTGNLNARNPEWWLDYQFATDGTVTISCRVTVGSLSPTTSQISKTLSIVTSADDNLFSSDADLIELEPDLMKYVPEGRNSWLREHRKAQSMIIAWLNKNGARDTAGEPLTKAAFLAVEDVRQWSIFLTLRLIFSALSNSNDDVYAKKATFFGTQEIDARYMAAIRLDLDGDAILNATEGFVFRSFPMVRG